MLQSPKLIYRHRKACLSKQPQRRAAGDSRLARGRSWVWAMAPPGTLHAIFVSILPSLPLGEIIYFAPSPPHPRGEVRVNKNDDDNNHNNKIVIMIMIMKIIMASCKTQHIHSVECSRHCCGILQAASRQKLTTWKQNNGTKLWEGSFIFSCNLVSWCLPLLG